MSAGGASGGDGEGGSLELKGSWENSGGCAAHGPCHPAYTWFGGRLVLVRVVVKVYRRTYRRLARGASGGTMFVASTPRTFLFCVYQCVLYTAAFLKIKIAHIVPRGVWSDMENSWLTYSQDMVFVWWFATCMVGTKWINNGLCLMALFHEKASKHCFLAIGI